MIEQEPVKLYDGAMVRLDVRGPKRPIFIADLCGHHYDIAGMTYDVNGQPLDPKSPKIVEIVRHQ